MNTVATQALVKWVNEGEWRADYDSVLAKHFQDILDDLDLDHSEVRDTIGEEDYMMLLGCAFEDFMSIRFEGNENVVDAFLKASAGRRLSDADKTYLRAVRDSYFSVYEIVDTEPGVSATFQDRIIGGKPVAITDPALIERLEPGNWVAARILKIGNARDCASGSLRLSTEQAESLIGVLRLEIETATKQSRKKTKDLIWTMDAPECALGMSTPLITSFWLETTLEDMGIGGSLRNADGQDIAMTMVSFLVQSDQQDEIASRLDRASRLRLNGGHWVWLAGGVEFAEGEEVDEDDDSIVLGTIELKPGELVMLVDSAERAWLGQGYVMGLLDGLVDDPQVDEVPMDDIDPELLSEAEDEEPA